MLTDETIRRIFEEEKNSPGLTRLPEDFFEQVKTYLENKSKMVKIEPDKWELDSVKRRLKKIFEGRERKILNSVPSFVDSGVPPENMTPEEGKLLEKVAVCIREFHSQREEEIEEGDEELVPVTILGDIPQFVGINMKNYGPFRKGDITTLPKPNAELLTKKKLAERMEMKQ